MTAASTSNAASLLAELTRAAAAGQSCPSNAELAELLGVGSIATPVRIMDALARAGLIRIERFAAARIVTIVATGQTTAHAGSRSPHFRAADPTGPDGAQLIDRLRREARARGVALTDLIRPLSHQPGAFLSQLERARYPKRRTIDRIDALLAGRPVELPPAKTKRDRAAPRAGLATATVELPAPVKSARHRSPEPCFRCGTRGGLPCRHRPQEGTPL